ncbi:hypothetical protein M5K25_026008 [Dendrobium thyrsiflorum]|uniref:Uncharacterized protein n=1 Tax=Dendrobium thyrsiflorum TaxID=117978 RepID=A0ABD0TWD0_DENTH
MDQRIQLQEIQEQEALPPFHYGDEKLFRAETVYDHKLKTGVRGNEDEPDQDPMVPSSRAVMFPGLLSQRSHLLDLKFEPLRLRFAVNMAIIGVTLKSHPSGVPSPAPGGRLQVNDLEVDAPEFEFSFNSSTGSVEDFHFIPGTPSSCLIIFIVFLEITSFVPSFLSSCCSVLKSPYLSPSSEISNAFVLVLMFQQALLLLDHHFDHHPRGLLLLLIARTEFDLLERLLFLKKWALSDASNRSLALHAVHELLQLEEYEADLWEAIPDVTPILTFFSSNFLSGSLGLQISFPFHRDLLSVDS